MRLGVPELFVLLAIALMSLVVIWPATRICRRMGFSPWLGVLIVIPLANLGFLWFVATAPWPRESSPK